MEIERKFTVKNLPEDLDSYPHSEITQAYLCREPVIRIRKRDNDYILTCKGSGLMMRQEFELPLSEEAFEHLLAKADGAMIQKKRYLIPLGTNSFGTELTAELDIFTKPRELIMAEVEFPDTQQALAFEMPDWFEADVTLDPAYHNSNMT